MNIELFGCNKCGEIQYCKLTHIFINMNLAEYHININPKLSDLKNLQVMYRDEAPVFEKAKSGIWCLVKNGEVIAREVN